MSKLVAITAMCTALSVTPADFQLPKEPFQIELSVSTEDLIPPQVPAPDIPPDTAVSNKPQIPASSITTNVVPNNSFEEASQWDFPAGSARVSKGRTGEYSAQLINAGNGTNSPNINIVQKSITGIVGGQEYKLTAWVSGENVTGEKLANGKQDPGAAPLFVVKWKDAEDKIVAKELYNWAPLGTYSWRELTTYAQAPESAVSADVTLRSWYKCLSGTTYWDDISITSVSYPTIVSIYEAEDAAIKGGSIESEESDYSGDGYVDITDTSATLDWEVVAGEAKYTLAIRYAWEGAPKKTELIVNGKSVGSVVPSMTGRRGSWATATWNAPLKAGKNSIQLKIAAGAGPKVKPQVDRLEIRSLSVVAVQPTEPVVSPPEVVPTPEVIPPLPVEPEVNVTNLESLNKVRFVGTGGDNNADGLTHKTRWATVAKAKGLPTGTDVYILAGTELLYTQWSINWSGTENDRAVIGCYYIKNNEPVTCAEAQQKPLFSGTYASSCRPEGFPMGNPNLASTCPINTKEAIPKGRFSGIIEVNNQQYFTIQDLDITDSSGAGIAIFENDSTPSKGIIQRNRIYQTYGRGFTLMGGAEGSRLIFRHNHVELTSLAVADARTKAGSACVVLESDGKTTNVLFEGNTIINCGGEGISSLRSNYNIFRGNTISQSRHTNMYADNSSYSVYEHNTTVGGGFGGIQKTGGAGPLTVRVEPYNKNTHNSMGNVMRNNLSLNAKRAFTVQVAVDSWLNCNPCNNPADMGFKSGIIAFGNTTVLSPVFSDSHLNTNNLTYEDKVNMDQVRFHNNLFIGPAKCAVENDLPKDKYSVGNNLYTQSTGGVCVSNNDKTNVKVTDNRTSEKMELSTELNPLDASKYPQVEDFSICKLSPAEWSKPLAVDYYCNPRTNYAGAIN